MGSRSRSGLARWQNEYSAALHETDTYRLAKCIEVAEAAVLVRREAMAQTGAGDCAEHDAIANALTRLEIMKRERLGFYSSLDERLRDDRLCGA